MKLKRGNTVCIDFDGVIHKYSKGWKDGSIYDEPNTEVLDFIEHLQNEGISVVVYSTRDPEEIWRWLIKYLECSVIDDFPFYNNYEIVGITNKKLAAQVYIDDRAYLYKGQSFEELEKDLEVI